MVHYKELGLVNTREMFRKAIEGGYAIPAYNFNNLEQLQAIIMGCLESRSPVILQVSKGARQYANQTLLRYMAQGAMEIVKLSPHPIQVALHLDHGDSYDLCVSFHPSRGPATMFEPYFLVPFLLAVNILLLEIGVVSRRSLRHQPRRHW